MISAVNEVTWGNVMFDEFCEVFWLSIERLYFVNM